MAASVVLDVKKPVIAPPPTPPIAETESLDTVKTMQLQGHVGFDTLPHQMVAKAVEQGFQFNVLCVGETGIGKTTLIESLFNMKLLFEPCNHELNSVELRSKTYDIEEGGINLKLTIVETAGFGDQLDKDKSSKVIVDYINDQYEKYLKEELKIKRCLVGFVDTRIHACLYFISPTGHGLKALDVTTMRALSKRVNVIPVVAKADTSCKDELNRFKAKIISELKAQKIPMYHFPTDDETVRQINTSLNELIPFAVVGSTDFVKMNGKSLRARRYPWGIVEVENEDHCDFVKLREALLRTNVDSLIERTHTQLYETYRQERLREMGVKDGDTGPKMVEAFAQKTKCQHEELQRRETEMQEEFKERVLKKEAELKRREDMLNQQQNDKEHEFKLQMANLEKELEQINDDKNRLETRINQHVAKSHTAGKKKKFVF